MQDMIFWVITDRFTTQSGLLWGPIALPGVAAPTVIHTVMHHLWITLWKERIRCSGPTPDHGDRTTAKDYGGYQS